MTHERQDADPRMTDEWLLDHFARSMAIARMEDDRHQMTTMVRSFANRVLQQFGGDGMYK